jgi:cysteinyl-tRNA synthetase
VAAIPEEGEVDAAAVTTYETAFRDALENDLNTSLAVTALYDVLKADINGATKRALIASFDKVLSLSLLEKAAALKEQDAAPVEGAEEIEALIAARTEAKKSKNWAEADRIRDELKAMGIEIKDTPNGVEWKKI